MTFLPGHDYLEDVNGLAQVRDLSTGKVREIPVRRKVVDARYQQAAIPATHTPSFRVDPEAAFIPVGELPERSNDYRRYVVIGGGKTSVDACLWLLDAGVEPDRIRWVRSREAWFNDRAQFQPLEQVGALMEGAADEAEAGAKARDVTALLHWLEDAGRFMRLDTGSEPTMYRITMLSRPEFADLQRVSGVIRRGHVRTVGSRSLTFDDGKMTIGRDELVIDRSARGIASPPTVPIFTDRSITLQQVRHGSPTFNAALLAFLEAHRDHDEERNRLAPPNPSPTKPADILMMLVRTWVAAERWRREPDVKHWISHSRLNLTRGVGATMNDPRVRAAVERYVTHLPQAMQNLRALAKA